MKTETPIKNGRAYPQALKLAALKASKSKKAKSAGAIADDFNISKSTLTLWRRKAGIQRPQPTGLAKHVSDKAAEKAYNTPTMQKNGTIMFRGVEYK
jgi:transposase-like protein